MLILCLHGLHASYVFLLCLGPRKVYVSVEGGPKEGELAYVLIGKKRDTKGKTELSHDMRDLLHILRPFARTRGGIISFTFPSMKLH